MASQEVILALESLHKELEKIEPAIRHVETAIEVTKTVKEIPVKHIELLNEVKELDIKHKEELKTLFSNELLTVTEETKKLQIVTTEIQGAVKSEIEALAKLKDTVQAFHERIGKINFPERLDKLDANISGIMAAIQSVQSRIDVLERNLADRLKDILDYQKETRTALESNSVKTHKKIQTNAIITWLLIIAGIFMLALLLKLKLI